jgi:hypothetical protein
VSAFAGADVEEEHGQEDGADRQQHRHECEVVVGGEDPHHHQDEAGS